MGNSVNRIDMTENQLKYKAITPDMWVDGVPIDLYAVVNERDDLVQQLVDMSCSFASVDENGCGALHLAAKHNTNILYTIFTNTSTHHLSDNHGRTPLHYAVIHGQRNHYSLLHEQLFTQDTHGDTPLHLAVRKGCIYSVQQLMELCPELPYKYYSYMTSPEQSILSSIVANKKHETALIYAIQHEMVDVVKTLAVYPLLIDDKVNGKSAKDHTIYLGRSKKDVALKILNIINV